MSDHDERPTATEAGRAGCEMVLLIILAVAILLGFPLVANVIAPLEQLSHNDTVQQIGR